MISKKEVRKFAYDLIVDGKNCITKLSDSDKEMFTSLLMESCLKHQSYEYLADADAHNEIPYILASYMRKRNPETAMQLLETMIDNAVKFSGNEIMDYLIEQEQEYELDKEYDLKYAY